MKSIEEIKNILKNSRGTTAYHIFSAVRGYPQATDGVMALAEAAECYWLLDAICSYSDADILDKDFSVWTLEVNRESQSAVLTGYNDTMEVIRQEIEYTNFPLDKVTLYLIRNIILLPSEY